MKNLLLLAIFATMLVPAVQAQENSIDSEPRPMPVRERLDDRRAMIQENREERKEKISDKKMELHGKVKTHARTVFDDFFSDLDDATQTEIKNLFAENHAAVQEIRENLKTQFEAAETPESREEIYDAMREEIDALHEQFHAELRSFVPEERLADFDAQKRAADQKIEQHAARRAELRTRREEARNRNFSERTQRLADRVSVILDQIVARAPDAETKVSLLENLANGIQKSLDRLDDRNLDASAIADRRELLTAVLDQIELLKFETTASPDQLVQEIEILLEL